MGINYNVGSLKVGRDHIVSEDKVSITNVYSDPCEQAVVDGLAGSQSFISFATEELEIAKVLQSALHNFLPPLKPVFVANTSVRYGDKWLDEIQSALKNMKMFFIVFGPKSFESHWLHMEAGAAWVQELRIIPLAHSGVEADRLPSPYNAFQGGAIDQVPSVQKLFSSLEGALNTQLNNTFDPEKFVAEINNAKP